MVKYVQTLVLRERTPSPAKHKMNPGTRLGEILMLHIVWNKGDAMGDAMGDAPRVEMYT